MGKLSEAMNDMNESLRVQPSLGQVHWERHLLYLIQGEDKVYKVIHCVTIVCFQLATDELTLLLKKDRKNVLAYIAKLDTQILLSI